MRHAIASALLLLTAGCRQDVAYLPTETDVDILEKRLSKIPCIGAMGQWFRAYEYRNRSRGLPLQEVHYSQYIEFAFEHAGLHGRPAGRVILRSIFLDNTFVDDDDHRIVTGYLDRSDNSIALEFCGREGDWTVYAADHPTIIRL